MTLVSDQPVDTDQPTGPVAPTPGATGAVVPAASTISSGLLADRRAANARAVADGPRRLEAAGNLDNLRLAAERRTGGFTGDFQFQDSDVYKWLEAAAWYLADHDDPQVRADVRSIIELVAAAQDDDGYLQTFYQVARPGHRWTELNWGHELYCAGHLLQAAVAHRRALRDDALMGVATRLADHIDATFGVGGRVQGICGHPLIESALVELYREVGDQRYLRLAATFVDRRGHGLLSGGDRGGTPPQPEYWQDHVPVRELEAVAGHAVRQLYLLSGATDLAVETGDSHLLSQLTRVWDDMVATKTYVTGGLGSRHDLERFGDDYELPNDRAYAETCAAIASVQWSWRLALATGRARYSDLIERTLYNAVLSGVSLDGNQYLYVNPLHVRSGHADHGGDQGVYRTPWFRCACCPPNVMRTLASLTHYVASSDAGGVQVHQYAPGSVRADVAGSQVILDVSTEYPWDGRIAVTVVEGAGEWTLSLRIPGWASGATVGGAAEGADVVEDDGWLRIRREWRPGHQVLLDLPMRPRLVAADPRIDANRGCLAVERGPLVYCVEDADLPPGAGELDDLVISRDAAVGSRHEPELLGGVTVLDLRGRAQVRQARRDWWPYAEAPSRPNTPASQEISLTAVPYFAWGNRGSGAMRVWVPA